MFYGAHAFNRDLSTWDVGAVIDMSYSTCNLYSWRSTFFCWWFPFSVSLHHPCIFFASSLHLLCIFFASSLIYNIVFFLSLKCFTRVVSICMTKNCEYCRHMMNWNKKKKIRKKNKTKKINIKLNKAYTKCNTMRVVQYSNRMEYSLRINSVGNNTKHKIKQFFQINLYRCIFRNEAYMRWEMKLSPSSPGVFQFWFTGILRDFGDVDGVGQCCCCRTQRLGFGVVLVLVACFLCTFFCRI